MKKDKFQVAEISQSKGGIAVGSVVDNPVTWQEQSKPSKTNRK